jgi:hypothetical protein
VLVVMPLAGFRRAVVQFRVLVLVLALFAFSRVSYRFLRDSLSVCLVLVMALLSWRLRPKRASGERSDNNHVRLLCPFPLAPCGSLGSGSALSAPFWCLNHLGWASVI